MLGLKEAQRQGTALEKILTKNMMLSLFQQPCSTLAVVSRNFQGPSCFYSSTSALPVVRPGSHHREVRFGRSTHVQLLLPSENLQHVLRPSFPKCSKMWLITRTIYHVQVLQLRHLAIFDVNGLPVKSATGCKTMAKRCCLVWSVPLLASVSETIHRHQMLSNYWPLHKWTNGCRVW